MRRSRSPASSYCIASGRDSSHWDVWAFKASLRLRFGTRCLGLEVSTAAKGKRSFARDCYLHQSPQQGYSDGATKYWEEDPVWNADSVLLPFREIPNNGRLAGYAG